MHWSEELKEFEWVAQMAPAGDVDAYRCNLEVVEKDPEDIEDILDDMQKDFEALHEDLMDELGDNDDEQLYVKQAGL